MSFPKAPLRRFNDAPTCAPPPGSYDIKTSDPSKGPVSFDKSERFRIQTGDAGNQQIPSNIKPTSSPANGRKLPAQRSRPSNCGMKAKKDLTVLKDMKNQKELEKEIRVLIAERGQQDRRLQALEEDLEKSESKLCAILREKTSLLANVASLEKQLLELSKTNELLKTKCFEDGAQKKVSSLLVELMKLRNRLNAKRVTFVKQKDMDSKLNVTQGTLEHSKEKVAQLEEQLMETEKQSEEKYDSEKLLEYIAELGNVAEQMGDKYNLDITHLEETIEAKNKDIEKLQTALQQKDTMLSTEVKELNEKYKMTEDQKEKMLTEYGEKERAMNAEIECLKEQLHLEKQEHQKQKEICKEISAATQQTLFVVQEEVAKERQILERELRETMDEVDKLHAKDAEAAKLLKYLGEKIESQAETIAQLEAKLERKNAELKKMTELHSNVIEKKQKEHSNALCKLGETTAEFEIYKSCAEKEIACLKEEKTTMEEKIIQMSKAFHQNTETMEELQHAKKAKEEYSRMLLDAQTKVTLKDAEIKRIKESSAMHIANLQARLEEQSEDFKKQLEIERKTIAEKLEADYKDSIETWRVLYEDLSNKVKPFQQQLDAYEAEKNALLNEHGAAQEELNKINDAYAKLLGHQNQKQKIKHVMKLKEENTQLKQEISKLRCQLAKEKQVREELQAQMNQIQGVKRFDPSKAFQHVPKENIPPKTPFKESNRRTAKLLSKEQEQNHM
ncbi:hyaluronan mediated motility receptor isoform X1 [Sceloporus undulatus]|uniref:hyaluronan mediated motility receptor isoform X1 n=1 Tax=Sceloporus undulatus TaxID=8520 RepID=UPI001C4BC155|nr:hyaluronan mediated motility receptor isoform X1 [Sceloporus undulatus]